MSHVSTKGAVATGTFQPSPDTTVVDEDKAAVVARDEGPGIADVPRAIAGGHSTSGGLGLGLSGVRRLMDEFEIISEPRKGTTVTIKRWKR